MAQKKHKPEEIVAKLRQVDVLVSQGRPVAEGRRIRRAVHRCDAVHLLPVAQGVRRAEDRPGEAAEGAREGERAASQGGLRSDA